MSTRPNPFTFLLAILKLRTSPFDLFTGFSQHKHGTGPLCLLAMASWCQVYLFDIQLCDSAGFSEYLKTILENKCIQKVAHGVDALANCLREHHGISICNVFDTQVSLLWTYMVCLKGLFNELIYRLTCLDLSLVEVLLKTIPKTDFFQKLLLYHSPNFRYNMYNLHFYCKWKADSFISLFWLKKWRKKS